MNENINILLTGGTGILGSHILFELIPLYVSGTFCGKIVVVSRGSRKFMAKERILEMLTNQYVPDFISRIPVDEILRHIEIIDSDLQHFSKQIIPDLPGGYFVIHAASSVNLGQGELVKTDLYQNNYLGTLHFINEVLPITRKFIFISTAYSSGHRNGMITDDFLSHNGYDFRNPYEYFKNQSEIFIRNTFSKAGISWQILRPSIICGRLTDTPLFVMPRFMVFYLFARFVINFSEQLKSEFIRFHVPAETAINIVPVDYVAKVVVEVLNHPVNQLNIVHPNSFLCRSLFKQGFDLINFKNYTFCETQPENQTRIEKFLHATVGQQLKPYIDTPGHRFDTTELKMIFKLYEVPEIEDYFCDLLTFAKCQNFTDLY